MKNTLALCNVSFAQPLFNFIIWKFLIIRVSPSVRGVVSKEAQEKILQIFNFEGIFGGTPKKYFYNNM